MQEQFTNMNERSTRMTHDFRTEQARAAAHTSEKEAEARREMDDRMVQHEKKITYYETQIFDYRSVVDDTLKRAEELKLQHDYNMQRKEEECNSQAKETQDYFAALQ